MKNEEKILDLLIDIVRNRNAGQQDRQEEIIKQNSEIIKRLDNSSAQHEERLNNLDDIAAGILTLLRDLAKRSGETDELRDRIQRLERHTGLS